MYLTNKDNLAMNVHAYISIQQICISIPVIHTARPPFEQIKTEGQVSQILKVSEDLKTLDLRADQILDGNMSRVGSLNFLLETKCWVQAITPVVVTSDHYVLQGSAHTLL